MRPPRPRSKTSRPSTNAPAALLPGAPSSQQSPETSSPTHEDDLEDTRAFFAVFRSKWAVLVMCVLDSPEGGSIRRNALAECVPSISEKVLTDTLHHLEKAGMVRREVFASVPPRVEYSLTEAGSRAMVPLRELNRWCRANHLSLQESLRLLKVKSR